MHRFSPKRRYVVVVWQLFALQIIQIMGCWGMLGTCSLLNHVCVPPFETAI